MFCLYFVERSALDSNLPFLGRRIVLAAAINLALAVLALGLKMVNRSGAVCGFLLGVAVYLGWGYKSFLLMFAFFAIGSVATRFGYARKAARGVAEKRGGARSWREALANSLAGAFFSLLVITTHHEGAFLMALIAAFAEATGDTVSSEIGQWLSDRAYLITTFKPVPAGEDGGICVGGSLAGALASALVVALAFSAGLVWKRRRRHCSCRRSGREPARQRAGRHHRTARPGDQRHREFCRHQLCRRAGACHRAAHRVLVLTQNPVYNFPAPTLE